MKGEEIKTKWKEYLEDLYEENKMAIENYTGIEEMFRVEDEIGSSIIKNEFTKAIHDQKSNKAVCIDKKLAELRKVVRKETRDILFQMAEKIY